MPTGGCIAEHQYTMINVSWSLSGLSLVIDLFGIRDDMLRRLEVASDHVQDTLCDR